MRPLDGLLVLDFSTLLPGPMASLVLAEAGARVVKIERIDRGDEMRSYEPKMGEDSVNFVLLNRGKQSIAIDLKSPDSIERLMPLLKRADVLIEQFRPGVMGRLGLGYEALRRINPRLIYCSITGWGQTGPKAQVAAHDLNYIAETGVLGISAGSDGAPPPPCPPCPSHGPRRSGRPSPRCRWWWRRRTAPPASSAQGPGGPRERETSRAWPACRASLWGSPARVSCYREWGAFFRGLPPLACVLVRRITCANDLGVPESPVAHRAR